MLTNFNMDIETRLANVYKTLGEPQLAGEREEMTADKFWASMSMVAMNNQSFVNYRNKNS